MNRFGFNILLDSQLDLLIKYRLILFGNLVNSLNISFGGFRENSELQGMCTKFSINITEKKISNVYIDISPSIKKKDIKFKRILNCYFFWLPYCIELSNNIKKSFELILNASDWGKENILSMTSTDTDNLIPDEYSMFQSKELPGLKSWNNYQDFYLDWSRRKSEMFWRGSTTGHDIRNTQSLSELQRIQICLKYSDINFFNMKITSIVQNYLPKQIINQWLDDSGIKGKRVAESKFANYKYYPDIPGNNTLCGSWGVIKKHVRGNLVFKPNHKSKMFYDKDMYPWKHYVPVKIDFSDLQNQLIWAENNHEKAANIAYSGYSKSVSILKEIKFIFLEKIKKKIKII